MGFLDRFKSKWKHSDPDVRLRAVKDLDDPEALAGIALDDDNFRVRAAAVKKIRDQVLLGKVASKDDKLEVRLLAVEAVHDQGVLMTLATENSMEKVQAAAIKRLRSANDLLHIALSGASEAARVAAARSIKETGPLLTIINNSPCEATRVAAVWSLESPKALASVALSEAPPSARLAAIEKLRGQTHKLEKDRTRIISAPFVHPGKKMGPDALLKELKALKKVEYANALVAIAKGPAHYLMRWEAVAMLADQEALAAIAREDDHERVRMAAAFVMDAQEDLMGLAASDGHHLVRIAALSRINNEASLMMICQTEPDYHARVAAVCRLEQEDLLAHIAQNDPMPAVRLVAGKKHQKKPVLQEAVGICKKLYLEEGKKRDGSRQDSVFTKADIKNLFAPYVLAAIARIDAPEALAKLKGASQTGGLADTAKSAGNLLVRLSAVDQIIAPSILWEVAAHIGKDILENARPLAPADDLVRWAALEKLGDSAFLSLAGFDAAYVKGISDPLLLLSVMTSDAFSDMRVYAENRLRVVLSLQD